MTEEVYGKSVPSGTGDILVDGLRRMRRVSCGGDLVSRAQMQQNDLRIRQAIQYTSNQ